MKRLLWLEDEMINWASYPKSRRPPLMAHKIVSVFEKMSKNIDSHNHDLSSNQVLELLSDGLREIGFAVESGKKKEDRIDVPVLFGHCGRTEKAFQTDAYNEREGIIVEVEAGRGVLNYQFLKDLFQACMMAEVKYAALAVRNMYKKNKDYVTVISFFETLYASNRLQLPLEGVLIIGY